MLLIRNDERMQQVSAGPRVTHGVDGSTVGGDVKLEIWVTDLDIEPQVIIEGNVLKLHLNAAHHLGDVIEREGSRVPEALAEHLRQLWEGECPDRIFRIVDQKTVVITSSEEFD